MAKKRSVLAIRGGTPVMKKPLPEPHNVGKEEIAAITKVIKEGPLSGFLGTASSRFLGGKHVKALEAAYAKKFKVKHAVAFNSATTALHASIVALGIGPGDEVIVPPYTMSSSVACAVQNGATPIFADLDEKTFCIDPASVESKITKRTKAIMVVDLFGQAADFDRLVPIAKKHGIALIEDNAQSPGATWHGRFVGTIADIGIFSLNVHKAIQTGEGGVLVTNDDKLALRAQLCRNHGETVVDRLEGYDGSPIIGSNYRMAEVIAAMARVQLKKLDFLTRKRVALAKRLEKALRDIPGITVPFVAPNNTHVYYRFALKIDEKTLGISRDTLADAMTAEGFPMPKGYVKPIYLLPMFQKKQAFNATHFPFEKNTYYDGDPDYSKGICPVVERLQEKEFTLTDVTQHPYTAKHVDLFVAALKKVIANKHELVQ